MGKRKAKYFYLVELMTPDLMYGYASHQTPSLIRAKETYAEWEAKGYQQAELRLLKCTRIKPATPR